MFEEAGVEPPETWEELLYVGEKIVEVHGEGKAISLAGTAAWDLIHNWAIILWSQGGEMLNEDNSKALFNSDAGYRAMEYYVELFKRDLAAKANAEYNQPQADAAFTNGDVAMYFMGPWNIAGIENDNPDLPYGVVQPPTGPAGKASFSGGSNLVIRNNASKEEIKAAKAWIKFLLREENLIDYTKNLSHMLPTKVEAFNDFYYNSGVWKTFKTTLDYATAYPPIVPWGQIEGAIVSNYKNVLSDYVNGLYDENTVKHYLGEAAAEVDYILESH